MNPLPLAVTVVGLLADAGQSLASAESLTGGLIGAALTAVPGASAVYRGGVITYTNLAKTALAAVGEDLLADKGAISAEAACAMASGARAVLGSDWAIAVTGVAGPEPSEGHQPGLVWIGLVDPSGAAVAERLETQGDREQIRSRTVDAALGLLAAALRRSGASTKS